MNLPKLLFFFCLLLAISLSTGTAIAQGCSAPTSITGGYSVALGRDICIGDGYIYDYTYGWSPDLYTNVCTGGGSCGQCQGGAVYWNSLCWWPGCASSEVSTYIFWFNFYFSYSEVEAATIAGCDGMVSSYGGYGGKLKKFKSPFNKQPDPLEVNILPWKHRTA